MQHSGQLALPATGYIRLRTVLQFYPVGKSTWWKMVAAGEAPPSVKLGRRCTAWKVEDIRKFLEAAAPKVVP